MEKRIIINSAELETRIALVEGNQLAEIQVQGRGEASIVGNIYKGRVLRVLPGMQAAFVDLGLEKAGFMHVSDFWSGPGEIDSAEIEIGSAEDSEAGPGVEPSLAAYVDDSETGPATGHPAPDPAADVGERHATETARDPEHDGDGDTIDVVESTTSAMESVEGSVPGGEENPAPAEGADADAGGPGERPGGTARSSRGRRGSRGGRRRSRRGRGKAAKAGAAIDPAPEPDSETIPAEARSESALDVPPEQVPPGADHDFRESPEEDAAERSPAPAGAPRPSIEELLSKGEEILVQVSKEPIGSKGARITSHISLPGRYVVYMPTTDHIGVSRRIEDEKERARLREIVSTGRGKASGGFIVRTACEGISKREILADMRFLSKLWGGIVKKAATASAPALLHEDLDMVLRAIRDLFTTEVTQVVVDRESDRDRIVDFVESVLQPRLKSRVEFYGAPEPVFDRFGIENQVHRALERRVWLKSGGYLVFDQTEALTSIDVNTGRFVGKKTHEETVLKTNLEAARVAIDQLRLRNIGGIIIIDFIDMDKAADRKKVSEALAEAVKRDKARTNILRISELGLVQMTRKRTRDNLRHLLTVACSGCNGEGRLRSVETLAAEALRTVRRTLATSPDAKVLRLRASAEVGRALLGPLSAGVREFEDRTGVRLEVEPDDRLGRSHSEIRIPGGDGREGRSRGGRKEPTRARPEAEARGEGPAPTDEA